MYNVVAPYFSDPQIILIPISILFAIISSQHSCTPFVFNLNCTLAQNEKESLAITPVLLTRNSCVYKSIARKAIRSGLSKIDTNTCNI